MQMRNKLREEKASMAVYVAVVLIAFLFILVGVCITLMSTRKGQLKTIMKIKESYEENNKNAGEIYNSMSVNKTPNATITVSSTAVLTSGSITAEIRQEAGAGNLDFSKCKYVYNTTKENIGTDVSSYTGGTLSSANSSITLSASTAGTYYLHVLTTNSGGSAVETISSPVAVVSNSSINYDTANTTSNPFSTFEAPADGTYKLQVWGAQGGYRSSTTYGGKGGYSIGTITLSKGDKLYVYVGGEGRSVTTATSSIYAGGYNGGGYRYGQKGGGGATDIRLVSGAWNNSASLLSRVIVAGGGGSDGATSKKGMYGGGTTGGSSTESYTANSTYCGKGGTQTYSGYSTSYTVTTQATTGLNSNSTSYYCGGFGFGGGGVYLSSGYGGAGGGGWYGGSGNVPDGSGDDDRGGGGGSGFIWTSGTASNVPSGYSVPTKYYLANASTTDGNTSFTSTSGSTETGHSGNGYAKITPVTVNGKSSTTTSKQPESITPTTPAGAEVKKASDWSNKVTAISDGSGTAIPLPSGFYYVGGNRTDGLVISDNEADKNKGTSYETASTLVGNQFVWIPVDNEETLTRTNFNTAGEPTTGLSTSNEEPYTSGYSDGKGTQETVDFNTMKTQVLKYKGFYIGRYEAGDNDSGTTLRTGVTTAHTLVVRKDVAPYNYVPWGKSISDISEASGKSGAVYLSTHMYNGKEQEEGIVSTLCYGSQWDAMCRYIGNSQRTTPSKSGPGLTGSVSTDVSKNIYDLAGNCFEWTMEGSNAFGRLYRGGDYSYANKIYVRNGDMPENAYRSYAFRPTFYIK